MPFTCDPCECPEQHYGDVITWQKAMLTLLCDIETAIGTFVSSENLWDRTGTILSPHTAGDSVDLGAGDLSATALTATGLTATGVTFIGAAGLFTEDNVNFNYNSTSKLLTVKEAQVNGDIIAGAANKGIRLDTVSGSLAATGTTVTDAAAITHCATTVSGGNGSNGVRLPAITSAADKGRIYMIFNASADAFKVYAESGGSINGSASLTLPVGVALIAIPIFNDTQWWALKGT